MYTLIPTSGENALLFMKCATPSHRVWPGISHRIILLIETSHAHFMIPTVMILRGGCGRTMASQRARNCRAFVRMWPRYSVNGILFNCLFMLHLTILSYRELAVVYTDTDLKGTQQSLHAGCQNLTQEVSNQTSSYKVHRRCRCKFYERLDCNAWMWTTVGEFAENSTLQYFDDKVQSVYCWLR